MSKISSLFEERISAGKSIMNLKDTSSFDNFIKAYKQWDKSNIDFLFKEINADNELYNSYLSCSKKKLDDTKWETSFIKDNDYYIKKTINKIKAKIYFLNNLKEKHSNINTEPLSANRAIHLKENISKNEIEFVINELWQNRSDYSKQQINKISIIYRDYQELKKREHLGTHSVHEANAQTNKIVLNILSFIDEI